MSQPHPPRPEDQPAQQPSDPREPRTQAIPVIPPETVVAPESQPVAPGQPGPAFTTEAGYLPGGAPPVSPAPTPGPATAPPPPVPPQPVAQQPAAPQPVPAQAAQPGPVWPQPGTPAPAAQPPARDQRAGAPDSLPGSDSPGTPQQPAGSTATGQLPSTGPGTAEGPTPGSAPGRAGGRGAAATRLGARFTGGLTAGSGRHPAVLAGLGLGVLGLVLLELGLALAFGNESLWSVLPTWSAFATVAIVVALLPLVLHWVPSAPAPGRTWRIGLAGAVGVGAFWVLVALPLVASDRGFLLTAGPALAAAAVWLAPGRGGERRSTPGTGSETGGSRVGGRA